MTRKIGNFVWAIALAALGTGCASTGAVPRPFPGAGQPSAAGQAAPQLSTHALVSTALGLRGVPYRNGGSDPQGFDCSGFTQWVFGQHGLALPREVRDQFREGRNVRRFEDVTAGDLVFFSTTARGASHVGIAIGGNEFVHAPSSTGVVRVESLSSSYWASRILGARRIAVN